MRHYICKNGFEDWYRKSKITGDLFKVLNAYLVHKGMRPMKKPKVKK